VSGQKVDVVRAIYDAWRDGRSARAYIAEDIEYVNPPDAVEPGVRHGRKWFAGIRGSYDDVVVEPLAFVEAPGEDVIVVARVTGRGRASGFPVEWHHGYVWTIRDGVAVRFRWFNRPEDAYRAVGLDAPPGGASAKR
jgi:ketosteroid isomerase-like protein